MKTSVTELPDSRVRVSVDVAAEDVDRQMKRAARGLAREMRVPGFRKGKAPPSMVIQRLGREAVLEQAVRDALPVWYEDALLDSGVRPVGDPEIKLTAMPEGAEDPLSFSFEVGVRPAAKLGSYKGLEVPRASAEVPDEVVERELDRLRDGFARLETVDRAAQEGDFLLMDFEGTIDGEPFEGGSASDYLFELGSGQLIEGFDEQLVEARAGEEREVKARFPNDSRAEQLAGKEAVFRTEVKEVREKILPELDDEFAAEASEFDSLEELRADVREKLAEAAKDRIESDFRLAAVDAAVKGATVELPEELVKARATERWERLERNLQARGIDPSSYLRLQGKSREEAIEAGREDAELELKREAVLAAVTDREEIEVSEQEMLDALAHTAEHERTTPQKLLERLRASGRDSLVRDDIRVRKAVDLLAESAKPIPLAQAEARERLWTPEKEQASQPASLWTPGAE